MYQEEVKQEEVIENTKLGGLQTGCVFAMGKNSAVFYGWNICLTKSLNVSQTQFWHRMKATCHSFGFYGRARQSKVYGILGFKKQKRIHSSNILMLCRFYIKILAWNDTFAYCIGYIL